MLGWRIVFETSECSLFDSGVNTSSDYLRPRTEWEGSVYFKDHLWHPQTKMNKGDANEGTGWWNWTTKKKLHRKIDEIAPKAKLM